jgi:hypothetical protein
MSLRACLDAPALGDEIRPATEQLGGHRRRQRDGFERSCRRTREREPAIGSRSQQRGELVARERDLLVHLRDPLAGRGQRSLGLLQLELRVDSGKVAIARQRVDVLTLLSVDWATSSCK